MIRFLFLSLVPLIGTSIGSTLGIFNNFNNKFEDQEEVLVAVATGILASISLNLFMEAFESLKNPSLFIGIFIGFLFIFIMNYFTRKNEKTNNINSKLFWAMLIHNIPEGIIIGIALANRNFVESFTLILSISLQNIPDGLVVSMPLVKIKGKNSALCYGVLSGIVEPIAAMIVVFTAAHTTNITRFEPLLTGFSLATVLMITIELLKDCKKKYRTVVAAAIFTTIFNAVFNGILG